jgi:hypothetical protein
MIPFFTKNLSNSFTLVQSFILLDLSIKGFDITHNELITQH